VDLSFWAYWLHLSLMLKTPAMTSDHGLDVILPLIKDDRNDADQHYELDHQTSRVPQMVEGPHP
jgi:hypothetical protein